MSLPARLFANALCLSLSFAVADAQPQQKPAKTKKASADAAAEVDPLAETRRTTVISLVTSLADEARSFRDHTLRARVQARAADALWETETERARALFRRAWEAAIAADEENDRRVEEEKKRQERERGSFSIQLPPSLRTEVLRLAAKRDRALGEEFLAEMDAAKKGGSAMTTAPFDSDGDVDRQTSGVTRRNDPSETPAPIAKRLRLAIQLLEDGDAERAIQFADPALGGVTLPALEFLARLRIKNAPAADERYAALVARAASDAAADPNTASLLSSYIFTPSLYVTFTPNGGSSANSWARNFPAPTDIAPQLRAAYFRAAAAILLRQIPPPDQDRTSTGRAGWYMVITRLLPLFDQFAPGASAQLRAQQAQLSLDTPERVRAPGNNALTRGLVPEDPNRDRVQESLNRLPNAKTSDERDSVYVDAVLSAIQQRDSRVEEFLNKIENLDLRQHLRSYVDFEAAERAIRDKDAAAALRHSRSIHLTPVQRTWVLTEAAKLHMKIEPGRSIELLDEALAEVKRIDETSPDRVRALVAIATQLAELDRPRAWEVAMEVVKAANDAEGFTGEDGRLNARIQTKNMTIRSSTSVQSFDLAGIFATLAREDLARATMLARDFKGESPRAVATLAIARAVLEKK